MTNSPTYLVTGASGQLGTLVIKHLKKLVPSENIIALVRSNEAANAYRAKNINTRIADYDDLGSLSTAFEGVSRILLISSNVLGQITKHHSNVINAAQNANVSFIAYTSLLKVIGSNLKLSVEHNATEELLNKSKIPSTILRNGWYSENLIAALPSEIEGGIVYGASGDGRYSTATRNDLAQAAAIVLANKGHEGKTYELTGDSAFSRGDYAEVISKITDTTVSFQNLPEETYKSTLIELGLPDNLAGALADAEAKAAKGALESVSKDLSSLIGHPTTTIEDSIKEAL